MRAIGFRGLPVVVSIMLESLILALAGGLLGALAAYVLFNNMAVSTLGANFTQVVFRFAVTPALVVDGLIIAVVDRHDRRLPAGAARRAPAGDDGAARRLSRGRPVDCRMLVDIGANLAHDSFDADRDAVLERARAAGRRSDGRDRQHARRHARRPLPSCRRHPGPAARDGRCAPAPCDGTSATRMPGRLAELLADPMVVAAGECGLDYFRNFSPPAEQRRAFELQLGLRRAAGKPLVPAPARCARGFHRDAARASRRRGSRRLALLHRRARGSSRIASRSASPIGITGWICDERRGQALREAAPRMPRERLMIETDAPYLLPRTLGRSLAHRRNEPAFLPAVLAETARCRGEIAGGPGAQRRRPMPAGSLALHWRDASDGNACDLGTDLDIR